MADISISVKICGNPITGWKFTFTATATDDMSDMNRVEFLFNNVVQETIYGIGPTYVWAIKYWPVPRASFRAKAYDNAGLFNSDELERPYVKSHSHSKIIHNFFQNLLRLYERFPILQRLFLGIGGI